MFRKRLALWLVCTLLCTLFAAAPPALAEDEIPTAGGDEEEEPETESCGDYEYAVLADGSAMIVSYSGDTAELVIPEELDGVPVSTLGIRAFSWHDEITSIVFPPSLTTLDDFCFSYCRKLKDVSLPATVLTVNGNPFAACESLEHIRLPEDHPT